LLENPQDKELVKTNLMLMVQWNIGRQASSLQARGTSDPEFADDLRYLIDALAAKLEDIRSEVKGCGGGGNTVPYL